MPPKQKKKGTVSSGRASQGNVHRGKNVTEVFSDSGDDFEHVAVEDDNSIDEAEAFENNETEGEDNDELALNPRLHRTGPPSTPSPVKLSGKKHVVVIPSAAANRDKETTVIPNRPKKTSAKVPSTPMKSPTGSSKKRAIANSDEEDINAPSPEYTTPKKARTKGQSTPSKSIKSAGKKRAVINSDEEDIFISSPLDNSAKKQRFEETLTPAKRVKNASRQLVFDNAVANVATSSTQENIEKEKKSPSKSDLPKTELSKKTVYLSDIDMEKVLLPPLKKCQIFSKELVDPLMVGTYTRLPKLPKMADFSSTWGPPSEQGGYMLSQVQSLYKSPDMKYIKSLITFNLETPGTIGNLSRIDPSLLGIKDANSFNKNMIHVQGFPSSPLLCFSVVITTTDNHIEGRTFGLNNEWIVKDISGVLPAMELERAIAVIGLAFKMPYVPADSARTAFDVLHFTMDDNAFSFSTSMMKDADYRREIAARAAEAAKSQSKRSVNKGLFSSASPAMTSDISPSSTLKPSLRPLDIVPVYDGRKRQLKIPDELRSIPALLSRYDGDIPYHSLILVAYTVSLYRASQGSRKDQPTVTLNISFAVVLEDGQDDVGDGQIAEEYHDEDDEDEEDVDEAMENQRSKGKKDLVVEGVDLSGDEAEEE